MIARRFPALTYPDYRIFWSGQFVSLIGSWMQSTVQPYLAYRLSGQPFDLGLVGFASAIPALFITLPAGVWIERMEKRKVVLAMQTILMLQAFTLAALVFTGVVTIWHIILIAFIQGVANSIEITARQSMFSELVEKEALPNAIALNSMIFNAARVIGPSLSAPFLLFMDGSGEGWAFLFNGISYLFVIGGLLRIKAHPVSRVKKPVTMQDFVEGQKFVRQNGLILILIMMVAIPSLFGFPFFHQIPVFAQDVLAVPGELATAGAARNSFMVTAQGVGALIASIFLAGFIGQRKKTVLLRIGQITFAVGLIIISLVRSLPFALIAMVLIGLGMVTQLTLTNTLIQLSVPDHLRGRVIATYLWAMQGSAPFGSLLIGALSQKLGAPTAVLIGGSICLVGYLGFHLTQSTLRNSQL